VWELIAFDAGILYVWTEKAVTIPHVVAVILVFILVVGFRTAVYDSLVAFQRGRAIQREAGYMILLQFLTLWFPWLCSLIMIELQKMFGPTPMGKLCLLLGWSVFLTIVYLTTRLVAARCLPYSKTPPLLLALQLTGDLFSGTNSQIDQFTTAQLTVCCACVCVCVSLSLSLSLSLS
jgi:hypothetical protein